MPRRRPDPAAPHPPAGWPLDDGPPAEGKGEVPAQADAEAEAVAWAGHERPSKSQRKRDSHALQDLGEALVELPASRLAAAEMPDTLREAIQTWKTTRSHEGRRRQMQLIGRLMRGVDAAPLRAAVDAHARGEAADALALHRAERERAELIASDDALTRWLGEHPGIDAQRLRTLVRNARKEALAAAAAAPPGAGGAARKGRAFRELFQFLREASG